MTRVQYRKFQQFMKWYAVIGVVVMLSVIAHHLITRA